jgi:HEAT repeat protein
MKVMTIAVAIGTMMVAVQERPVQTRHFVQGDSDVVLSDAKDMHLPPPAWADADPADSLYRTARRALTQKDYETAAKLFDSIAAKYPKSDYAPDALYWKGFALYKSGILDEAIDALDLQAKRYPQAATRSDAAALLIQLKGQLARRGDASAQREVESAAAGSGKPCGDMEMQTAALDAIQQMDAERVIPLLKKVLARRDACSASLRKNALFILSQKSGAERERILLEVAKSDPSLDVRQDAVFNLSQARSDASVDALEDLLLHSDERGVRNNALFALAQNKSERARKIVRTFALSENVPVALRKDAIFQLSAGGNAADIAWLKDAYGKIGDADIRKDIVFQVASKNAPETNRWLAGIIVDPKENLEQRKDALFQLASHQADGADDLPAVYDKVNNAALRKDVLFHMATRHDAASLDKLIAIAKSDPSPELRKEALFHIGQSKDPRALKALEEIVNP